MLTASPLPEAPILLAALATAKVADGQLERAGQLLNRISGDLPAPEVGGALIAQLTALGADLPSRPAAAATGLACLANAAAEAVDAAAVGAIWRERQDPPECGAHGEAPPPPVMLVEMSGFRHGLGAQVGLELR